MRSGRHAAGDGSFGRSAGVQTLRGAGLLVVAVLVGVLLLNTAPNEVTAVSTTTHKVPKSTLPKLPVPTTASPTTTSPPRPPAQVAVLVLNGTHVSGAASRIKSQLLQAGYNTVGTGNANGGGDAASTVIDYAPGYRAEAAILAGTLSLPATAVHPLTSPAPAPDLKGATIVVVVGSDLASQLSSGSGPPPTTSPHSATTASHTTTTVKH